MKKLDTPFVVVLISCLLTLSSSYAELGTINWEYRYYGHTGVSEAEGEYLMFPDVQAQNSESYARIGIAEDYDPGYWEDWWTLHLRSETEVVNSQGITAASSQTPSSVDPMMGMGHISIDLNESVEALSWTSTQSVYSSDSTEAVTIKFGTNAFDSGFNLPAGLDGYVKLYFGVWENEITSDNMMLDEKNGWSISQFDFKGTQYSLLEKTFTPSSTSGGADWSLDFQAGQDYTFFTYMEAEVVPEPMTLLLLGVGVLVIRRRK